MSLCICKISQNLIRLAVTSMMYILPDIDWPRRGFFLFHYDVVLVYKRTALLQDKKNSESLIKPVLGVSCMGKWEFTVVFFLVGLDIQTEDL